SRGRKRAVVEAVETAEGGPSTSAGADCSAGPTSLTTSAGAGSASTDAAAGVDEERVSAAAVVGS
ncbi:hypothetical protein NDU88_006457, partial [Pleurodeles waltl]